MQRGMNFKPNADGCVMLYIRNQSPGAKEESNWLPALKDKFAPVLAEGGLTHHSQRHMEHSRGEEGQLSRGHGCNCAGR